jgi:hypothetical protein
MECEYAGNDGLLAEENRGRAVGQGRRCRVVRLGGRSATMKWKGAVLMED